MNAPLLPVVVHLQGDYLLAFALLLVLIFFSIGVFWFANWLANWLNDLVVPKLRGSRK